MKKLIATILTVLLAATIASAILVGYNRSDVSTQINTHNSFDEYHDTNLTINAPDNLAAGEEFVITGKLTDAQTGDPLAGKEISVYVESVFEQSAKVLTDSDGRYEATRTIPEDNREVEKVNATYFGDR